MQIFSSSVTNVLFNYTHLINAQYGAALKYYLPHHNTFFYIYNVFNPTIVENYFEHTFYFC